VRNLTALFEDKSDTQSSSKVSKQKERANTSLIKKVHFQKEGRSNSSPQITLASLVVPIVSLLYKVFPIAGGTPALSGSKYPYEYSLASPEIIL
jgi:hypothetical protein